MKRSPHHLPINVFNRGQEGANAKVVLERGIVQVQAAPEWCLVIGVGVWDAMCIVLAEEAPQYGMTLYRPHKQRIQSYSTVQEICTPSVRNGVESSDGG
ncbi:hypothetical protein H257_19373 [Aphanomyces astaci]|uniref:Uncharacterized protein n=1 Tax=Aphanomyces astaci TaxID=112090 RepID=W4F894_APHAT|nr:hypothetical protein H257_19373 [Aphanomyces astaci]ETV63695.1 hypothetical protein H257_19373 [Aphanomyces astaci]|eukprot:XP_009846821.1 hypothetical protein H257_19373 [Aphanomyces astaci]